MEKTIKILYCQNCHDVIETPDKIKLYEETGQQEECPCCGLMAYTIGVLTYVVRGYKFL